MTYNVFSGTLNPTHFTSLQNGLTFLLLAYSDCPEKEAIKWVSVLAVCYAVEAYLCNAASFVTGHSEGADG